MSHINSSFFQLLNTKFDRVREMQSLTLIQFDLINERKYSELSTALTDRDKIMEEYTAISEKLLQYNVSEFSDDDKNQLNDIEKQIEKIMDEIRTNNDKLQKMLIDRKEQCREEIKELNATKESVRAYYNNNSDFASFYFDKKG